MAPSDGPAVGGESIPGVTGATRETCVTGDIICVTASGAVAPPDESLLSFAAFNISLPFDQRPVEIPLTLCSCPERQIVSPARFAESTVAGAHR